MPKTYKLFTNKWIFGVLAVIAAVIAYYTVPGDVYPDAPIMTSIVILMAVLWIFEVIPIAITSILPIILFPLFGIMDTKSTALFYGKEIIFLFLGGLMLAQGIQESNLHKRIALHIVRFIGSKPASLILGFMVATGFLSMWISNTASVMVMMPIGLSIIEEIKGVKESENFISKFAVALMLSIAYAADIGGMATLIGTPPNLVFMDMYHEFFPELPKVGFTQWMLMGLPISITFMLTGWLLMTKVIFRLPKAKIFNDSSIIKNQLALLGKMRRDEASAGIVFLIAAILWLTGSDITLSETLTIKGWRTALNLPMVSDASIAVVTATLLFMIPSKDRPGEMMLKWN